MNGLDFFFSPSPTVDSSIRNNGEDDDWGDFVDSSLSPNPNGSLTDPNGSDSELNRIESEKKKNQAQCVTSRGPVPLSVFGEEEEEDDESGASVSSFGFSFDSFSGKHKNGYGSVNRVVNSNSNSNMNHNVGISGLIANLYRENGSNELNLNDLSSSKNLEMNGNDLSSSNREIENSVVRLETMNWNPLNLSTEKTSNVVNSSTTLDPNYSDFDDDVDGWEFKTGESMFRSADGGDKEERENAKNGSVVVQNITDLSSGVWSSPATNGTGPSFDTGNIDSVKSSFDQENGDDDTWDDGGWEFKVAETREPKNDLIDKESNDWGFGFGFEPVSKIETTTSFQSNVEKEPQKIENGSISFPSNGDLNFGETSWAFQQPSLETGKEEEEKEVETDKPKEKEVQTDKPKGVLPLSFFEDEKLETSDTLVHEDSFALASDFPVREKSKAPSPAVSITDLISSLYSQVEEKNAVNLTDMAATDSNVVNGEDDSWEFQGPKKPITDSGIAEVADDFDSTWEFQGPSPALKNSDVTEGVDEFDDDSWEFQGPSQPVKDSMSRIGDNGSWEYKRSSVENEVVNKSFAPNGFGELHEKPVIRIDPTDYQDIFYKLKIELYHIALNHLEKLKEARDKAADSDEVLEVQKCNSEIEDLENCLKNDVLMSEVNQESLEPRSSGITELITTLKEPKFRALDSEDLLTERLLSAEKDWKSTIELLKHATLKLKILNLGSSEQQSKYASAWFAIASACAQELRHAASIWKQVTKNDVQEQILSKTQGKNYVLSVGEIYRVVKILRASTRLYKPWILLAPTSSNVLDVLDECVTLWLSSGLQEALLCNLNNQGLDSDYSVDQLLDSIKYIDEIDAFTLYTCITSATSPTCYISGLNTDIVPGIKTVEWNGEHYLLPLVNLWANLISRDPPSIPGPHFPTIS